MKDLGVGEPGLENKKVWRQQRAPRRGIAGTYKLDGNPSAADLAQLQSEPSVLLAANLNSPDGLPDVLASDLDEGWCKLFLALLRFNRIIQESADADRSKSSND